MDRFKKWRLIFLLICYKLVLINNISAQNISCNTITADMNFTVASVKITGRWISVKLQQKVEQLIGVGQLFNPATVGLAEELVRKEIVDNETIFNTRLLGSTSVLFITSDVCPIADSTAIKKVKVVIRSYYLRIDLYNIGNNILPIPRTSKPTFYKQVPSILLATAPYIGLLNDSRYGFSAFIKINTDLLHIPGIARPSDKLKKLHLDLGFNFGKSFYNPFYNVEALLQLSHPVYAESVLGWGFGVLYASSQQPLGFNKYSSNVTRIFGAIQGNANSIFFNKYSIGGSIEFSKNKYTQQNNKFQNPQTDYTLNAFSDGSIAKGFSRLGLWFNASIPKNDINLKSYYRLAGKFGYEVGLGKGHNTINLETIISYGHTWQTPPAYSEYFAGNIATNFLYTPLSSFNNSYFPQGPTIRSVGEKQGGITAPINNTLSGGTSYWGLNLSFSIPVSKWAQPLIPDIIIQESPRKITLRSAIKGQVNTAKSAIADDLAINGGLTDDEAYAAAERIVNKDIKPTINYLADKANIYSIKPVIFFDVGQVNKRNFGSKIWVASGAGLQINIVNARLELGYIQTLFPKSEAAKGNFLIRFLVQHFY